MTVIIGTRPETDKDFAKLAAYFLKTNPEMIKLWEKNLKRYPNDIHAQKLVKAGREYLRAVRLNNMKIEVSTKKLAPVAEVKKAEKAGKKFTHLS